VRVEDKKSISNMLNEELDIDSDDEMNLENEGESVSKVSSESECESETNVVHIYGLEDMTVDDKKPKAYTFTENAGPQLNLLPDAETMDYFSLFFNDELLNNIVIETDMYVRHKILKYLIFGLF
jgi:Ni2+-binding GTPase involved in maturation of urease and hydrogenase